MIGAAFFFSHAERLESAILSISFEQLDFIEPSDSLINSNWGRVNLVFDASSSFQYFNLVSNGTWAIENVAIPNLSANSGPQSMSFDFDLGNLSGVDVTSIIYGANLGTTAFGTPPPLSTAIATVKDATVTVGGLAGPLGSIPQATSLVGGAVSTTSAFHKDVPNQDVGVNECAPGAFSNSLQWLDPENKIPADLKSIDGLKGILGWTAAGGVGVNAWQAKATALAPFVSTTYFGPANGGLIMGGTTEIDQAITELQHGEDVEIWGDHHTAALSGIVKLANGEYEIFVTHDTAQGAAGGTVTEPIFYDPTTGLLSGGAPGFFAGSRIRGFIGESPLPVPEPSTYGSIGAFILGVLCFLRRRNRSRTIDAVEAPV